MIEFCSVDRRLLPTCYVPLVDLDQAGHLTTEAIEMGAAALLIASGCPPTHSPSHVALDAVWAAASEASFPSSSTSAAPVTSSTRTTSATACRSRPTSTAARRTSAPSTTWPSPRHRPRRWPR